MFLQPFECHFLLDTECAERIKAPVGPRLRCDARSLVWHPSITAQMSGIAKTHEKLPH